MTVLVLCVDRDDDLGTKAGVVTPVIGRADFLKGAISLGLEDPEDSDTNCMFAAVKIHDELMDRDQDVEVAGIAGDRNVGLESDEIIASQLDRTLKEVKPKSVILVSDGAEDEFILPIVQSRVKVNSVRRVVVRQDKNLEGTYYIITKALQDEKIQRKFIVPFSLICMLYGILALFDRGEIAVAAIVFTLGVYFMMRVFHMEEPLMSAGSDLASALRTRGYIEATFGVVAGFLLIYGIFFEAYYPLRDMDFRDWEFLLQFADLALWWIMAPLVIYTVGRTLDLAIRRGRFLKTAFPIIFLLFSVGFFMMGFLEILMYLFIDGYTLKIDEVFLWILTGGFLGFLSYMSYGYVQSKRQLPGRRRQWSV